MKKYQHLKDYEKVADIHARRLSAAVNKTQFLFPFTPESLSLLQDEQVALLDMMTTRFGKLQDIIGVKIFPIILDILGENAPSFRDKLNSLEKLGVIDDAQWWMEMREIRNQITHDYPENYNVLSADFNKMLPFVQGLIVFWEKLKIYIGTLPQCVGLSNEQ
ncbi:MAG: hypothetical protein U1E78_04840 [Gammaproteobacteria bacterium]